MTKQIALRLPESLVKAVDIIVAADDSLATRSAALNQAVRDFVDVRSRRAVDAAIVNGYERIPAGTVDEWGDCDAAALAAALANAARLDAEDGGW